MKMLSMERTYFILVRVVVWLSDDGFVGCCKTMYLDVLEFCACLSFGSVVDVIGLDIVEVASWKW
jgi:hypothetical protein